MNHVTIGVDPGDSTGIAMLWNCQLWHVFQGKPEDAVTLIELTIDRFHGQDKGEVAIACERFVAMSTRGRTHQPTAQRVGGALEHLAKKNEIKFRWQGPADAWAIASNERLKQLGMLQTAESVKQPDANDANMAVRHALLYESSTHATAFHELLKKHGVVL